MSTHIMNRHPAGRPIGGRFAPTEHGEADVALLGLGQDFEPDAAGGWADCVGFDGTNPDSEGDPWREEYERSSDEVRVVSRQDGVYRMEATEHGPSGEVSWSTVRSEGGIDMVVGQGRTDGMEEAQRAAKAAARPTPGKLAWAQCLGMEGTFAPYTGTDPNVDEPALTWTSPGGREIHLCGIGETHMRAYWDGDGDDDFATSFEPDPARGDEGVREALRDAALEAAVHSAAWQVQGLPTGGDMYELREVSASRRADDEGGVELTLTQYADESPDGQDHDLVVSWGAADGHLSVWRDGHRLEGEAETAELDAILTDSRVDWSGSPRAHAAGALRDVLQQAAADPDAPDWVKAAAAGR